jgi:hypothetical protein
LFKYDLVVVLLPLRVRPQYLSAIGPTYEYIQHIELLKTKTKELTVAEVKKTIYKEIQKKKKLICPEKFNTRIVEDRLAEEEAMKQIYAMILREENRRETKQINK